MIDEGGGCRALEKRERVRECWVHEQKHEERCNRLESTTVKYFTSVEMGISQNELAPRLLVS